MARYTIAETSFKTKAEIENRCRQILSSVGDGGSVEGSDLAFLLDLFSNHDEWLEKTHGSVDVNVTTGTTAYGTRGFYLVRSDESTIDISFKHAVKCLGGRYNPVRQRLDDFIRAARIAVEEQIYQFRKGEFSRSPEMVCPVLGVKVFNNPDAHVDHVPPTTFSQLLYDYCSLNCVNPTKVKVYSVNGEEPLIGDPVVLSTWQDYHATHAVLRVVSKDANLRLPKNKIDWSIYL